MKKAAALLKAGDHIETNNEQEFRVLSSERSGDMMWMLVGYTKGGPTLNLKVAPDTEFTVLAESVPYSKEFDKGRV